MVENIPIEIFRRTLEEIGKGFLQEN